jgi:hypothetical protein
MELEEYFRTALSKFEGKMASFFEKTPDQTKKQIIDKGEMQSVLESLVDMGEYIIVDIRSASFDKFRSSERIGNKIRLKWYEEFEQESENKVSAYVEFNPEKMMIYYDSMRSINSLIAIKAKEVKISDVQDRKTVYEDDFGEELILLHPKGSKYIQKNFEAAEQIKEFLK